MYLKTVKTNRNSTFQKVFKDISSHSTQDNFLCPRQICFLDKYRQDSQKSIFKADDLETIGEKISKYDIPSLKPYQNFNKRNYRPDLEKARQVFEFINNKAKIKHHQISEKGFWIYLVHETFLDFTQNRFVKEEDPKKFANQILRYYLTKERSFSNPILGLYLIIKSTIVFKEETWFDEKKYDYLLYSKLVCQDLPDYKMIFQHRMSRSPKMLFSILECLRRFIEDEKMELGKYEIQQAMANLSLILPASNLQILETEEIIKVIQDLFFDLENQKYRNKSEKSINQLRRFKQKIS